MTCGCTGKRMCLYHEGFADGAREQRLADLARLAAGATNAGMWLSGAPLVSVHGRPSKGNTNT